MQRKLLLGNLFLVVALSASAAGTSSEVQLLMNAPDCVTERLGQVSISLGTKEPNLRTGMRPNSVSYEKAFDRLQEAASAAGGDAVILRGHEASYFTKSARQARRPTFLVLRGAVVKLRGHGTGCMLAKLDRAAFVRDALAKERTDAVKDTGMAF